MSKKRLTPEIEDVAVARYLAGEATDKIAANILDTPISKTIIVNMLKRRGVTMRPARTKQNPVVTDEQRRRAAELCREGHKIDDAAKIVGVSPKTVDNALREYDVSLPIGRPRIYEVDDCAFDVLTPETQYWSGFLFADGCVYQGDGAPQIILFLSAKDTDHLEKFKHFLRSTYPIRRSESYRVEGRFFVSHSPRSRHICDTLQRRGMVTKRTRTPVPELAKSRDFWRGCLDGDGCLGTSLIRGNIYPYFGLAGQIPLLEAFQQFLVDNGINRLNVVPTEGKRMAEIGTSGQMAARTIDLLYRDGVESLSRKNRRAQQIIVDPRVVLPLYKEEAACLSVDDDLVAEAAADV